MANNIWWLVMKKTTTDGLQNKILCDSDDEDNIVYFSGLITRNSLVDHGILTNKSTMFKSICVEKA